MNTLRSQSNSTPGLYTLEVGGRLGPVGAYTEPAEALSDAISAASANEGAVIRLLGIERDHTLTDGPRGWEWSV